MFYFFKRPSEVFRILELIPVTIVTEGPNAHIDSDNGIPSGLNHTTRHAQQKYGEILAGFSFYDLYAFYFAFGYVSMLG